MRHRWPTPRASRTSFLVAALATAASHASVARADDVTLAQCIVANDQALDLQHAGKLLAARKAFATCAAPACGPEVSDACQKGIGEVNNALPTIVFVPKNGAGEDVPGVALFVDGAPSTGRIDGSAVVLDPGVHVFRFEAAGQAPVTKEFVLRAGDTKRTETILIGPPPPPAPPPPAPKAQAIEIHVVDEHGAAGPKYDSTGNAQRIAGTLVLAIGLPLTLIGGATEGIVAWSQWDSAKTDCQNLGCGPGSKAQNERHEALVAATSADIWAAAAGVVLVGGIVLRVTAPRRLIAGLDEVQVAPVALAGGGGLLLRGEFQ
jgi:hypothetical protein